MNDKILKPGNNIVHSGIVNSRPAIHLYEYRAWIKKGDVQRPLQDGSNVVSGRICCGSWQEAVPLVIERMRALCEKNEVPDDSFDISFLAIKEMDIPLT